GRARVEDRREVAIANPIPIRELSRAPDWLVVDPRSGQRVQVFDVESIAASDDAKMLPGHARMRNRNVTDWTPAHDCDFPAKLDMPARLRSANNVKPGHGIFPPTERELFTSAPPAPFYSLIPSNADAWGRRRRRSSLGGASLSTHRTAWSSHLGPSSSLSSCQWAIARKNQSKPSPPLLSFIDLSRAATASAQLPAR